LWEGHGVRLELEERDMSGFPGPRDPDVRWSPATTVALVVSTSAGLWALIALLTLRLAHGL